MEKLVEENAQLTETLESAKHVKQYRSTPTPPGKRTCKLSMVESCDCTLLSDFVHNLAVQRNEEVSLLRRLKDVVDAQKVELRSQRRILTQRTIDLDAVSSSILLIEMTLLKTCW